MVRVAVRHALRAIAAGNERGALPEKPVVLSTSVGVTHASPLHHDINDVIATKINGREYTLTGAADKTLLRMLREDAKLIGTKEGCAEGECGACTVFLDGAAVMACMVPAPRAHGAEVVTVEGLAAYHEAEGEKQKAELHPSSFILHPLQQAFIDEAAVQCGYCTPGFLMSGAKLLEEWPHPSRTEIEQALTGNLCRCTGYYKILAAMEKAAS
jgi:carbon-monoxide dehydrogenase medium subunit